jgi:CubicO group peptidase (beta-lactamase class C family)
MRRRIWVALNVLDDRSGELRELVTRSLEEHHVPGAVVGIVLDDQEHVECFGVTSSDNPLPVTPDTLFQIGSTTKTFVATAIMRLVEQGAIDLDVPIRTYLPDLKLEDEDVARRVTMWHLLTHTGGWVGDYFGDTGDGTDALARTVAELANLQQLTPLGEVWSYNNSGFCIAGRVLSVVTGQEFEDALTDLVLNPLDMTNSFFFANDVITRRFAVGHITIDGRPTIARPWYLPRGNHPAGGINSSVKDQLKYARFHLGDGTAPDGSRLLTAATMQAMMGEEAQAGGAIDWVGLPWLLRDIGSARLVTHGGATNGQKSSFVLVPERHFAFTMLTNSESGDPVLDETERWLLEHILGVVEPELPKREVPPHELEAYAGRYESPYGLLDLTVEDRDLVLRLSPKPFLEKMDPEPPAPPPTRLSFYGVDRVVALDGELKGSRGDFLRRDDGSLAWLRIFSRVARRVEEEV